MSEKLKPCPFCGSENLYIDSGEFFREYEIRCTKCGGRICWFDTKAEAITAWNRRVHNE